MTVVRCIELWRAEDTLACQTLVSQNVELLNLVLLSCLRFGDYYYVDRSVWRSKRVKGCKFCLHLAAKGGIKRQKAGLFMYFSDHQFIRGLGLYGSLYSELLKCGEHLGRILVVHHVDNLLFNSVIWFLVVGVSFWAIVIVYEVYFQCRGRSRAERAVIKALLGGNVLHLYLPQRIAYVARGSFQSLRIQLSVLGREQDLDNATLKEVRKFPVHPCPLIPLHEHSITFPKSESTSAEEYSSSLASIEVPTKVDLDKEALEVELLCSMCTIPLGAGEPLLTLPCLHQFHLECVYDAVGRQFACPACLLPVDLRREYIMREHEI